MQLIAYFSVFKGNSIKHLLPINLDICRFKQRNRPIVYCCFKIQDGGIRLIYHKSLCTHMYPRLQLIKNGYKYMKYRQQYIFNYLWFHYR